MKYYRIVRAQECYCRSHNETINSVAREGKYLTTNDGFSYNNILGFFRYCEQKGFPQFYVIDENDRAVGWCDIVHRDGTPHGVGYIGVGLLPEYREQGIGRELMSVAMRAAEDVGFSEIRLECRTSNSRALHLYKKLGFKQCGVLRKTLQIDGEKVSMVCMKLKLKDWSGCSE